jgi:hypothetical protein
MLIRYGTGFARRSEAGQMFDARIALSRKDGSRLFRLQWHAAPRDLGLAK